MFYLKHWILTCTRLFQAFVLFKEGTAALAFYADLTQRTEVVKTGFLMASLVLGDSVIVRHFFQLIQPINTFLALKIYRLWIVWGYNKKIIIFPICTLAGLVGEYFSSSNQAAIYLIFKQCSSLWSRCYISVRYIQARRKRFSVRCWALDNKRCRFYTVVCSISFDIIRGF